MELNFFLDFEDYFLMMYSKGKLGLIRFPREFFLNQAQNKLVCLCTNLIRDKTFCWQY